MRLVAIVSRTTAAIVLTEQTAIDGQEEPLWERQSQMRETNKIHQLANIWDTCKEYTYQNKCLGHYIHQTLPYKKSKLKLI